MRPLFACLLVALQATIALAQIDSALNELKQLTAPPKSPRNARELGMLRAFYDKTVWADEVKAQEYERTIVNLWDRFIHQEDNFKVLADTRFEELVFNTQRKTRQFDWAIFRSDFGGPSKTVTFDEWLDLLDKFKQDGFEIEDTEWHHSEFHPPESGPARSVISMVMHVHYRKARRRMIVKGDLKITWSTEPSGPRALYEPVTVDATGLHITHRDGEPAFGERKELSFQLDGMGKTHPNTIHPVILHDLNGDHLPEVVIAGYNEVYWNRGNWDFVKAPLCDHPSRLVNAAVLADFTGDGVTDLLCGLKNGFPQLYAGTSDGKFPDAPREIKIAERRLRVPVGMTAGDVDGDGDIDVFVGQLKAGYQTGEIPTPYYDANDSFPSFLMLNDGDGNFHDAIEESGLAKKRHRRNFGATFVDLDSDGDLDLLLTSDFCGNDLFLNDGEGRFTDVTESLTPRSYVHGMSHTFGDYNLDGKLDFLTIGMSSTTARRLDRMQLGRPDFPEYNRQRSKMGYGNRMYLNRTLARGESVFSQAGFNDQVARTGWSWGSTTLDFDRDGDQDVYVVNGQTSGRTTQDYCTRYWCHDLYFKAEDRPDEAIKQFFGGMATMFDGNKISWNGYEHNALLMNLDGKGFTNVGFLMGCASVLDSRAAVSGDLDLDGRVDLIYEHNDIRNGKSGLHFLRNQWEDEHHWIGVHLVPNSTCPSTQGAKVAVQLADGRILLQHRLTGHSVWVQHSDTLHFGVGKQSDVKQIGVYWPNGVRSRLQSPAVDQYHVLSPPTK